MSLVSMFVFPAPQPSYTMHSFPNELVWIPCGPLDGRPPDKGVIDDGKNQTGDSVPAIILRSPAARFLIIYFHSNGEDIGLAYPFGCGLRMVLEVHVLLVEYPGYGICPGQCSEDGLWQVAQAAFRFATETLNWPLEDVIIMGRSLGASVAMRLACHYSCHGLILVAPFLSLVEAVSQYVGNLAPFFVGNSFCNRDFICKVRLPTLVIHGVNDRLVACHQGRTLWEMCPHKKKLFVCPEQMSHNSDLLSNADFLIRPMLRFFALPDYSFVELEIPAEAFDKRQCPQYHTLVETVKSDGPLARPGGDEEPCPVSATMVGPISARSSLALPSGDDDDFLDDGSEGYPTLPKMPVPSCAQDMVQEDVERLAAEMGLRLPVGAHGRPALPTGPADDPGLLARELTGEMLSGLSAFLHGNDLPVASDGKAKASWQRSWRLDAPLELSGVHTAGHSVSNLKPQRHISGPAKEVSPPPVELDVEMEIGLGPPVSHTASSFGEVECPSTAKSTAMVVPSMGLPKDGSTFSMDGSEDPDPEPEEEDEVWAARSVFSVQAAKEPMLLKSKPRQPRERSEQPHPLAASSSSKYPPQSGEEQATPTSAGAVDATQSEEESTAVPSTAEASVEPDCKAPAVQGHADAITFNLDTGISRFMHEAHG